MPQLQKCFLNSYQGKVYDYNSGGNIALLAIQCSELNHSLSNVLLNL